MSRVLGHQLLNPFIIHMKQTPKREDINRKINFFRYKIWEPIFIV